MGYLCANLWAIMGRKPVLYAHITVLLLFLGNIILASATGYSLKSGIMLAACIGYFLTLAGCFVYAKSFNSMLTGRWGRGIGYVVAISAILLVELLMVCISALFVFVVLVFDFGATVKASGKGYEIRLQPSFAWPPRYVLYKSNALTEKRIGDIHANEDDFKLKGDILQISIAGDSATAIMNNYGKDTVVTFGR